MRSFYYFIKDVYKSRTLILNLAQKDLHNRYLGSFLGITWAFIQPTITILIFWFVFQVGFKSMPVDNFPFILWLISAMVPWFFFNDSVQSATNSIVENSYLVKKVVFRVSILPIVKIVSSLFVHIFFIFFMFLMFMVYGYTPDIHYLQIFYYLASMIVLLVGISWITSSLVIFFKDMGQIVSMLLQFGFWLTPIFWSMDILPQKYHSWFKLNPFYYIAEGYRNSLIYKKWFWEYPYLTLYFWFFTLICILLGVFLFKRLRPHFSDVL